MSSIYPKVGAATVDSTKIVFKGVFQLFSI